VSDLAVQIVVLAKEPVPGRVKTRLTPPFTPREAATLAEAALADTLEVVRRTRVVRRVLCLAGEPTFWLPDGFDVIPQQGAGLDERIAAAMWDTYAGLPLPTVLIGMDTPQVTAGLLEAAAEPLARTMADAAFGPAEDGGFWLLGLRRPDPALVRGVPMSTSRTGDLQLARLAGAGLRVRRLPRLRDVDDATDAAVVAGQAPGGRFAAALRAAQAQPVLAAAAR
jgi:hypothetical protein